MKRKRIDAFFMETFVPYTRRALSWRHWRDRGAAYVVTIGGWLIILSVLAILFVILLEALPLFYPPSAKVVRAISLPVAEPVVASGIVASGVDEYREKAFLLSRSGSLSVVSLESERISAEGSLLVDSDQSIASAVHVEGDAYLAGTSDGSVIPFSVMFKPEYGHDGTRTVTASIERLPAIALKTAPETAVTLISGSRQARGLTVAAVRPEGQVEVVYEKRVVPLMGGEPRREVVHQTFTPEFTEAISAIAVDTRGRQLALATETGAIALYDIAFGQVPSFRVRSALSRAAPITALQYLIGDYTLIAGDAAGGVASWMIVPPSLAGAQERLAKVHSFRSHAGAVVRVAPSRRNRQFITADASGVVMSHFGISGRTLGVFGLPQRYSDIQSVYLAPKADAFMMLSDGGAEMVEWRLHNPHPEVSWRTLFGKVWYEGYREPEYVWQSTGGSDVFQEKISLVPLIFGTFKATAYAVLFAVPLALLGALYTSQFAPPRVRAVVKPTVELMAALPSVIIGFLAALWLAPKVEAYLPGIILMPIILCGFAVGAHRLTMMITRRNASAGVELFILLPVLLAGMAVSLHVGELAEAFLLGGDYQKWLTAHFGVKYDQRNSIVVGIAMGLAVIPIIFTIAEDTLSAVPKHIVAASLALGATRWQTALSVVIPVAIPGIFSAVMIGLGRAIGETMIVLMATGNTPVMDWSAFNGFRALSANIAVELPEAPYHGTLYRVLFLSALLLFMFTFVINTLSEVVRVRLRKKFRML